MVTASIVRSLSTARAATQRIRTRSTTSTAQHVRTTHTGRNTSQPRQTGQDCALLSGSEYQRGLEFHEPSQYAASYLYNRRSFVVHTERRPRSAEDIRPGLLGRAQDRDHHPSIRSSDSLVKLHCLAGAREHAASSEMGRPFQNKLMEGVRIWVNYAGCGCGCGVANGGRMDEKQKTIGNDGLKTPCVFVWRAEPGRSTQLVVVAL